MKKFYQKLTGAVCLALGVLFSCTQANAEMADWYFSNDLGGWTLDETCQFQTTEQTDVFILPSFNLAGSTGYKITNAAWSEYYGWADGGSIAETGVAYPLGEMESGNGWCALPTGTYDITFDRAAKTIMFVLSENQQDIDEGNDWYLTGPFAANNWTLDFKFTQSTDDENLFTLEKFTVTEADIVEGYWNFVIVSEGWASQYCFLEDCAALGVEYNFISRYDDLTAFSSLPADVYNFTWNKKEHTLKIERNATDGIAFTEADLNETEAEYYSISGTKIVSNDMPKGIYIKKCGNKVEKVIR